MKRFNYTGRKKILREDVKIRLHGTFDEKPKVDVAIELTDYEFPAGGDVFLEPQRKTRFMRIPLGKVSNNLRKNSIQLEEFDDAEDLSFRVKVVDQEEGLLFGIAENIKPYDKSNQQDDNQLSILPVSSVDLSAAGVLWRVEYGEQKVILQIERELGTREQVVRSLLFRGFILPAAMRQILIYVTSEPWDPELSDPEELPTCWLLFARQLGAGLPSLNASMAEKEEWADTVARILAFQIGVRKQIIEDFAAGAWK